jgi:hypothetical protein
MTSIGRTYATEERARDAARRLLEDGFASDTIAVVTPADGPRALPRSVPRHQAIAYGRDLQAGHHVVVVEAPFNWGQVATGHLLAAGPVSPVGVPRVSPRNPAPFSDFIGFPTLSTRGRSYLSKVFPELASSSYAFSSMLGLKMLSRNPAPLSSMVGLKTVSKSRGPYRPTIPLPLLSKRQR